MHKTVINSSQFQQSKVWDSKKIISEIVFIFIFLNDLTYKQLETHGRILSSVATDGLVVSTRPSVATVLTKCWLYWTSFTPKYNNYSEQHPYTKSQFEKNYIVVTHSSVDNENIQVNQIQRHKYADNCTTFNFIVMFMIVHVIFCSYFWPAFSDVAHPSLYCPDLPPAGTWAVSGNVMYGVTRTIK